MIRNCVHLQFSHKMIFGPSFLINENKKKNMKREKNGMEMLLIVRLMCGPLCQVNQKSIALDANQLKLANNG